MNVQFCDLCNESIPLSDLDSGRAVRRNERLICAACESAMSGHHARPEGRDAAHLPPPPAHAAPHGSAVPAVALAFASVALVVAVGGSAYGLWRLQETQRHASAELERLARSVPEQTRSASNELLALAQRTEVALSDNQRELVELGRRLDALERGAESSSALERRLDKLEEKLALVLDLSSRIDHQAATLAELELAVAQGADAAGGAAPVVQREAESGREASRESTLGTAPAPVAEATPSWQGQLADLASPTGSTRWQAVQSLGKTRDPRVVPHLVPLLEDSDLFVRMAVARLLGELGSHEAIPPLIDALEDEEMTVRETAFVSLKMLSGQAIAFDPKGKDGERSKRVKAWREWWEQASKELLGAGKKTRE